MTPPKIAPHPPRRFRITLDEAGAVALDYPSAEVKQVILEGLRKTITRDDNRRLTRSGLTIDLEGIPPELAAEMAPAGGQDGE